MSLLKNLNDNLEKIDKVQLEFRSNVEFGHESFDNVLSNITSFFNYGLEGINNIIKSIGGDINNINGEELSKSLFKIKSLDIDLKNIAESGNIKLSEIGNIQIPVVLGQKLNVLDTIKELNIAVNNIEKNLENVLKETDEIIGKTLGSKDFRTASRPHYTKTDVRSCYFEVDKVVSNIIDGNNTKDKMKLDVYLPSLNSVIDINEDIIKFNKIVNVNFIKNLKTDLSRLIERSEILYNYIKKNDDVMISKAVLNLVSDRLDFTARYATTITSIIFLIKHTIESYLVCAEAIKNYNDKKISR